MTVGRIYNVNVSTPAAPPKGRIYQVSLSGAGLTTPKGRIYNINMTGAATFNVLPIADQTVEPEMLVIVTTSLSNGASADSYTWRQVSGPSVTFTSNDQILAFVSPSVMPNATTPIVVGVKATYKGVTSVERFSTITVLPQTDWAWNGTNFVGSPIRYVTPNGGTAYYGHSPYGSSTYGSNN